MAEQKDWTQLMVWLSICGFFRGSALSNFTLTVSEYCSLEKLPSAFGWHLVGKAVFVICFGPLIGKKLDWIANIEPSINIYLTFAGLIRDVTQSYPICIHAQSVCIFLCGIAWCIEYVIDYSRRRKVQNAANGDVTDALTTENKQ